MSEQILEAPARAVIAPAHARAALARMAANFSVRLLGLSLWALAAWPVIGWAWRLAVSLSAQPATID